MNGRAEILSCKSRSHDGDWRSSGFRWAGLIAQEETSQDVAPVQISCAYGGLPLVLEQGKFQIGSLFEGLGPKKSHGCNPIVAPWGWGRSTNRQRAEALGCPARRLAEPTGLMLWWDCLSLWCVARPAPCLLSDTRQTHVRHSVDTRKTHGRHCVFT